MRYLPVVDSENTKNLMYLIKVSELKDYCELYFGYVNDGKDEEGSQLTKNQPPNSPMKMPNPKNIKQKLLDNNIENDKNDNVFNMYSETGHKLATNIL